MVEESLDQVRQRFRQARGRTADREGRLSEDDFLSLPARLQNQLAVLQGQCEEPLEDDREALLAVEHNLKSYNTKLEQALNLRAQLDGARKRRETDRRAGMIKTVIFVGLLVALLGGGWLLYGHARERKTELCRTSEACTLNGHCAAGVQVELPSVELVCLASTDSDCRQSQRCKKSGECYQSLGRCIAKDDQDCRKTSRCELDGACTVKNGRCVAVTREDCRSTPGCMEKGKCSPQQGICVPLSDEDCRHSMACKRFGACTEVQSQCVPVRD